VDFALFLPLNAGLIGNTPINGAVMVFKLVIYGVFLVDASAGWLCTSPGTAC
jgi:hypothetical protein